MRGRKAGPTDFWEVLGTREQETCLLLTLSLSFSLIFKEAVTFTAYKSPPFFPLPLPGAWREGLDSLQGRAGQELPHPPYQTCLPARPRPVPCTVAGRAEPRQSQPARLKQTDVPESWQRANTGRPKKAQVGLAAGC